MNIASKELCQELYKLSGWEYETTQYYSINNGVKIAALDEGTIINVCGTGDKFVCPAYDLGYLLRKLPDGATVKHYTYPEVSGWEAEYYWDAKDGTGEGNSCGADTPEDAGCKLCIELFKQGILTKEDK